MIDDKPLIYNNIDVVKNKSKSKSKSKRTKKLNKKNINI